MQIPPKQPLFEMTATGGFSGAFQLGGSRVVKTLDHECPETRVTKEDKIKHNKPTTKIIVIVIVIVIIVIIIMMIMIIKLAMDPRQMLTLYLINEMSYI